MVDGGYRNESEEWETVHEKLANAMHSLHDAISPYLKSKKLKSILENESIEENITLAN